MADYELIGLNEAAPDLRAPTSADRGIVVGGVRVAGLSELDGGADINGDPVATVSRTNPLRQAVRVAMTAATSGSNGMSALNSTTYDLGTRNATFHWRGSIAANTTTTEAHRLVGKYQDLNNRWQIAYTPSTKTLAFQANKAAVVVVLASVVLPVALPFNTVFDYSVVLTRETASAAGSVVFYINGVSVGTVAITAAATVDISNTGVLNISGNTVAGLLRLPTDTYSAALYNRALSAAEVLSLCVNGPALADIGASQIPVYASDFSAGVDGWTAPNSGTTATGNIDAIDGEDNWLRLQRTSVGQTSLIARKASALSKTGNARVEIKIHNQLTISGVTRFRIGDNPSLSSLPVRVVTVPVGTTATFVVDAYQGGGTLDVTTCDANGANTNINQNDTFYIKSVVTYNAGITGQWNAQDAQSDTGQIFDSSGNKNHAMLPAAGATIIGKEVSVPKQVRWTNTWAGTNELQYIGGVNQAILPAKAYIESIVGVVTGATVEDIIIGDGSDTDRYVTLTTGLAAGTVTFTLANRTTDGTNLKLTVDPDANATMSIAWTITYRTLE